VIPANHIESAGKKSKFHTEALRIRHIVSGMIEIGIEENRAIGKCWGKMRHSSIFFAFPEPVTRPANDVITSEIISLTNIDLVRPECILTNLPMRGSALFAPYTSVSESS
jgi:hypothetical protein